MRHKEVDVPSIFEPGGWQWQNIVAYATQHRHEAGQEYVLRIQLKEKTQMKK